MKYTRQNYENDLTSPRIQHTASEEHFQAFYEELGRCPKQKKQNHPEHTDFVTPRGFILELGCHVGFNLIKFARMGYTVLGVDISYTLLEEARRRIWREPEEVRNRIGLLQAWIEKLELTKKYETIILTEVLEHVIDPISILIKAHSLLTDDGLCYISVPVERTGTNSHVRGIDRCSLEIMLEAADLVPHHWYQTEITLQVSVKKNES